MRIRYYLIILFVVIVQPLFAQSDSIDTDIYVEYEVDKLMYWFDMSDQMNYAEYTGTAMQLDVSSLTEGFHTLHYQVLTTNKEVSPVRTLFFFRTAPIEESKDYAIQTLRYWFDRDYRPVETAYKSGISSIDASHLNEGFHTLYYQAVDDKGEVSPVRALFFFRTAPVEESKDYTIQTLRYWFDENDSTQQEVTNIDGFIQIDMAHLSEGKHTVHYQIITGENEVSPTYSSVAERCFGKYSATFVVDGIPVWIKTMNANDTIILPDSPQKEGYTFTGWGEVPKLMPDSNVVITGAFILNAEQADAQGLAYLLDEKKDEFSVSGYTHKLMADITIPDTMYGLPVKAILNGALKNAGVLETIVLPAGIASVGESAFSGCRNLLIVEWNADAALHASCFDAAEEYGNMLVFVQGANSSVNFGGNVVVDGVAEKITLTDGMPFRNPKQFTAKYISYSREFSKKTKVGASGGWEGIVLPFAVQTIISEKKGILSPFGAGTEGLPCWVAEWLAGSRSFMLTPSNLANKPFIMEVPNSEDYEEKFNIDGVLTFMAENVTVEATADNTPASGNGFTLRGSYEGVTADEYTYALNDEVYITDEGTSYLPGGVFVADSRDVRPFEAYVYNNLLTRLRYLSIEQGSNANSIPVEMLKDDRLVDVYTLQGIMVKRQIPVEELEKELPTGIYIVNGMKMVVK